MRDRSSNKTLCVASMRPHRALSMALLLISALAASFSSGAAARLYKWTDADGKVHYSDTLPPAAARHQREIKSDDGRTVDRIAPPPTPEELAAAARAREAELRRQQELEQQAHRDRILLLTFTSVEEMRRARDDRIAALEGRIQLHHSRIEKLQTQIDTLSKRAAALERSGRGNPAEVHAEIEQLQKIVAENERFIEQSRQEQAEIRSAFDADIDRFKQLKVGRVAREPASSAGDHSED